VNEKDVEYTGINRLFHSDTLQTLMGKLSDGTYKEFIGDWKWIFSFSARYKWMVAAYLIVGILSSTFGIAASYASSMMINIITEKQMDKLPLLIGLTLGTSALSLVLTSVQSRVNAKISVRVNNDIQAEIFDSIVDVKWSELSRYKNGDLLNRFNDDTQTVSENAIAWIPNTLISLYSFILAFVVLYRMDHIMAWIAVLSAPILFLLSRFVMRKQRSFIKQLRELKSEMMSFEAEAFYNMDTVKAFGVWRVLSKRLRAWQAIYKEQKLGYNGFHIKMNAAMTVFGDVVGLGALGYCLFRLWTGQILFGDMTFFLNQRSALPTKFNNLILTIPSMMVAAVSTHRIREVVDLPKETHNRESYEAVKIHAEKGLSVELKDVDFSYTANQTVYEKARFSAHPGEIVAVVGESGGGKTTLFRLLLGMLEPSGGEVVLRNANGETVNMNADLRQFVSYVPQGNTMILGTIAENMRLVKENATDEEIIEALKIACAWEFVEPIGIYKELRERGRGVSEGQAQRLSIARAVLRDAPILLLDEATSALDETTEAKVIHNLLSASPNKTIVVSTHRLSMLIRCNRIYRIHDKKIGEARLVKKDGEPEEKER